MLLIFETLVSARCCVFMHKGNGSIALNDSYLNKLV